MQTTRLCEENANTDQGILDFPVNRVVFLRDLF